MIIKKAGYHITRKGDIVNLSALSESDIDTLPNKAKWQGLLNNRIEVWTDDGKYSQTESETHVNNIVGELC